ncbi:MAG: tetratricopeptide repeat protein [Planctomycetota bacterium]|jgi:tetratricopeptide (TPR) repeat protein
MDIDVYQQCPCHSEKKIKFCCGKEVVAGLNDVLDKSQAGQTAAALEQIDRLIARDGEKDCLATLRIKILMSLGQVEEAVAANERFLGRNPGHFLGLQNRSMLWLMEGDVKQSYESLQDAIDSVSGPRIPSSFSKAFETLGAMLFRAGLVLAGRQHLEAALRINPENEQAQMLLMEATQLRGLLMFLVRPFELPKVPQGDAPWIKKYENVGRAMKRGQFRKARQILNKALELAPQEQALLEADAVVATAGLEPVDLNRAFRAMGQDGRFAYHQRLEAEAIAQLVETEDWETLDEVVVTYPLEDFEAISTAALSNRRLRQINVDGMEADENGPPPRMAFWFLDREALADGAEPTLENLPVVWGLVALYGRQTDRPARLTWQGVRSERFEAIQAELRQQLPGLDATAATTEVREEVSVEEYSREQRRLPPAAAKRATLDQIEREATRDFLLNRWLDLPNPHLAKKTPREVAGQKEFEIPLQACLLVYHLQYGARFWIEEVLQETRQKLGLGAVPELEVSGEFSEGFSVPFVLFLDPKKLTTGRLGWSLGASTLAGLTQYADRICEELLRRDDLASARLSRSMVLQTRAMLAVEDDRCFECLAEARREASKEQRSIGELLVTELEQRLMRGRFNGVRRLFEEIQANYLDNPRVEQQLFRALMNMGLVTQDGRVRLPAETPERPASGGLWTPDGGGSSDSGTAAVAEPTGGSKLWIPGT